MKKEHQNNHPFTVPEGYFEGFPDRLKERLSGESRGEVPVRRMGRYGALRIAIAASLVGIALLSIPLSRVLAPGAGDQEADMAYLEEMGIYHSDYELATYLGGDDPEGADAAGEEAFLTEAIEYLAMSDIEMDILFE